MFMAALAVAACGSCSLFDDIVCTTGIEYGLAITVVDARDRTPLIDVAGSARSGTFVDSLQRSRNVLFGAEERAGVYRVEVSHDGYQTWVREAVLVTKDRCHVRTVRLEARLEPVSNVWRHTDPTTH